jgi:hypothetical protein
MTGSAGHDEGMNAKADAGARWYGTTCIPRTGPQRRKN